MKTKNLTKLNMQNKNKNGFTLIELLIVISIIGTLAVALLPSVLNAPARARDAVRKTDLNNMVTLLETYAADNGHYPQGSGCIDTLVDGSGGPDFNTYFNGGRAPKDPNGKAPDGNNSGQGCGGYYYCAMNLQNSNNNYYLSSYAEVQTNGNSAIGTACNPQTEPTLVNGSGHTYIIVH